MRAVLQRITEAHVKVEGEIIGRSEAGFLILICAMSGDSETQADKLASKISKLRVFADEAGKMNRSILDVQGSALVVSQFTLAADLRGNRPGFSTAAPPAEGKRLYDYFTQKLISLGVPCQKGRFGADMAVSLTNDGPITIWMDSDTL